MWELSLVQAYASCARAWDGHPLDSGQSCTTRSVCCSQTGSTELGWLGANRLSFPALGAGASAFLVFRCSATRALILTLTVRGHHVETRG